MRDFTLALRSLARSPMLAAFVVLSLGLGIGGNTAVFSVLHQVLLQQLPVANPETLVLVSTPKEFKSGRSSSNSSGGMDAIFSYPMFRGLEKDPKGLTALAAFRQLPINLSYDGKAQTGDAMLVSGKFFALLGVRPHSGRLLEPDDDHGAGRPVAVLSHSYWQSRLGSDLSVLNRSIVVNAQPFTIVGIAPPGFHGPTLGQAPNVFVPLTYFSIFDSSRNEPERWNDYWLYLVGRLQPGVSQTQAAAGLQNTYRGLVAAQAASLEKPSPDYLERFRNQQITLTEGRMGRSGYREDMRKPLLLLLVVAFLVLLIAAANAANLLLARGASRQRELAIRVTLGASRAAIVRQLLAEALLLAFGGGLAGLLIGSWVVNIFQVVMTDGPTQSSFLSTQLDPLMLAFTFGLSLLTGLLFGLYPAWAAARDAAGVTLKDESMQSTGTRSKARVRRLLVCAQIGGSLALLLPMGLFLKSLINVSKVDLGMETRDFYTFQISPERNRYTTDQSRRLFQQAEEKLAAIPGVRGVTTAMVPVLSNNNWGSDLTTDLKDNQPAQRNSSLNMISPGYFAQFGIPLIAGRDFTVRDSSTAPKVAMVNESFVRHFFPGVNPLGHKFAEGTGPTAIPNIEIVGIVRDSKYSSPRHENGPVYYKPYRQQPRLGYLVFYLRTALPEAQIAKQVRQVMSELDRNLPLEEMRTLERQIDQTLRDDYLVARLAAAFAGLATLLAMIGLYGVLAFNVSRRTREFGIRMALGAESSSIRGMVLRDVAIVFGFGVALGLPFAYLLGRAAESQLFGVKPYDLPVAVAAVFTLGLAAFAAGYIPAARASHLNPTQALRHE